MQKIVQNEIQRLRESEEKYRKMIEQAGDAIFAIDSVTGRILEANPKAAEMTGYSQEELVGKSVWDIHPEDEIDQAKALFKKVSEEGCGYLDNLHFRRKDGQRLVIDVSASVIRYGDKRIIQRICRDVTERRELEQRNAALRAYYESILDLMPVGLGVIRNVDKTPEVEFENDKLKRMFIDKSGAKAPRCNWYEKHPGKQSPKATYLTDTGEYAEERVLPDGHIYLFTSNYFRAEDDAWCELQVIQDITQRRRLEDELQKANEELESKVEERTRELKEKQVQLVQAEKMASLGSLVAGIAHEINTPLGALISNLDIFIRAIGKMEALLAQPGIAGSISQNAELKKYFKTIENLNAVNKTAASRIVAIVKSLRKFARLDEAEIASVDLHEGIDNTLTLLRHELKNRVTVHKQYGALPAVKCYPNRLNQVFMNLLVNAAHAIEGRGDIYITTRLKGEHVIIEIRDTGKGIAPENLGRIFSPGFTTKSAGVGTGLGLSIVYQVIQEHHGKIEVESEINQGTTFRITLPLVLK